MNHQEVEASVSSEFSEGLSELELRPVRTSYSSYSQMDRRQTSKKEIIGWLSFALAAEPFTVAGIGIYIPILLEQYARENAVLSSDHSMPCTHPRTEGSYDPPPSMLPGEDTKCVVSALGLFVDPASFALYTFSISVFLQALVVICMSGAADRGNFRKSLLLLFSGIGGISAILFATATSSAYHYTAFLTIVGNISFGAVTVCGNAFLPVMVRNHPDVVNAAYKSIDLNHSQSTFSQPFASITQQGTRSNEGQHEEPVRQGPPLNSKILAQEEALLSFESFPPETVDPEARTYFDHDQTDAEAVMAIEVSNRLSGMGVACGYLSAFVVQALGVGFVAAMGSTMLSIRLVLVFIGIWWIGFMIPTALYMRPRPGPRLIFREKDKVFVQYVKYAWVTLFHTVREVKKLKDVVIYLCGWFILSDSATTISTTSILFARTELKMEPAALAVVGIITVVFGIIGAILFSRYVQIYLKVPPNQLIVLIVLITAFIPAYGLLGFVTDSIGLHHAWEIYTMAALYGICLGGMASVCRSVFSMLIPPGKESTFFSLYAVTDKGSSVFGPAVTAFITDKTHNIRYTFYFLFILLLIAVPLFYFLDVERGKLEAERFVEREEEAGQNLFE
ncbi:autophagy-related protein 22-like protein [Dipodascopsis uninucleata]